MICKGLALTLLLLAVPASAKYGGKKRSHHDACEAELSDGPVGATVEIQLGNLPPSTAEKPVFLSWWAAKESKKKYSPLSNPSQAEMYGCMGRAYASHGDPDFNGGKVRVTEEGKATVRVRPPAIYRGHHGGSGRSPHVHFSICGSRGRPQKLEFRKSGVAPKVRGGCHRHSESDTLSYTVLSAREIDSGSAVKPEDEPEQESVIAVKPEDKPENEPVSAVKPEEEKDWDALEFSPVYQCLNGEELFDQFSSECTSQCPDHAAMVHGQCVRKQVSEGKTAPLAASWRLHVDCNDKCWADVIPASRHMIRVALADHLDITFQEAKHVQLRKDSGSPTTHVHLKVKVHTNRLGADLGSSLLKSFLPNASMVTDLLGLTVHEVTQVDGADDQGNNDKLDNTLPEEISDALPEEISDDYAEYYVPLEDEAERRARESKRNTIAGIEVPEDVPVPVIVGAAAGLVTLLVIVAVWLHCRRRKLSADANDSTGKIGKEEEKVADDKATEVSKEEITQMAV